jgi:uncharacterized protein YukE
MSIARALLRLARRIVEQVTAQLMQQINIVEDQVNREINNYIQRIVGGAWQGDDAERFVDELSSLVLPDVSEILNAVTETNTCINSAVTALNEADQRVTNLVGDLAERFRQIY